jgi:rhodanese-related sulfurtransferase/DNA-binding transcriptional ArsR family regulator
MSTAEGNPSLFLFTQFASVAQGLGHSHRLLLLQLLAQGERPVEALAGASGLGLTNVSQHLQRLSRAGLVVSRRQGRQIFYRLSDEIVLTLVETLRKVAERRLAEVRAVFHDYFQNLDNLGPVSRHELLRRLKRKGVVVIDVRPSEEYAAGHLPGAINLPANELAQRLVELPRDQEIVAYCRGPYCVMSYEAVHLLRQRGFKALRLEDGYPEWKAAGLPVESGQTNGEGGLRSARNGYPKREAVKSPRNSKRTV